MDHFRIKFVYTILCSLLFWQTIKFTLPRKTNATTTGKINIITQPLLNVKIGGINEKRMPVKGIYVITMSGRQTWSNIMWVFQQNIECDTPVLCGIKISNYKNSEIFFFMSRNFFLSQFFEKILYRIFGSGKLWENCRFHPIFAKKGLRSSTKTTIDWFVLFAFYFSILWRGNELDAGKSVKNLIWVGSSHLQHFRHYFKRSHSTQRLLF